MSSQNKQFLAPPFLEEKGNPQIFYVCLQIWLTSQHIIWLSSALWPLFTKAGKKAAYNIYEGWVNMKVIF